MIKGFYKEELGFARPYVLAKIIFPKFDISEHLEFLVDSGADSTMISERDAMRIGLDYTKLEKSKKDVGGIGGKAETYVAEVIIKIQRDFVERVKVLVIKHLIPEDMKEEERKELVNLYRRIPSILGRDIIDNFGLFMHKRTHRILLLRDDEIPKELFE